MPRPLPGGYNVVGVMVLKVIRRMLSMCEISWELLIRALQLSCVLLFCSFMLFLSSGPLTIWNYDTYKLAQEFSTLPQAILLVAMIAGAVIEERSL